MFKEFWYLENMATRLPWTLNAFLFSLYRCMLKFITLQTSFFSKPLGQFQWDIMWSIPSWREERFVKKIVMWPKWLPCPYLVKTLKNLIVKNHRSDFKIISQECSLGAYFQKLLKEFWYLEKHGCQAALNYIHVW